jgi:hypothetical protein
MISTYVRLKFESPEAGLIVGLVLSLMLTEFRLSRRQDQ